MNRKTQKPFNWAHLLSLLRIILAGVTACVISQQDWVAATWFFCLAAITDVLDGPLSRRLGLASRLGTIPHHSADAIFVTIVTCALWKGGYLPAILPVAIFAAFLQYVLDSKAFSGKPLRTNRLGKLNGIGYFILIGIALFANSTATMDNLAPMVNSLGYLLSITTLLSMISRAFPKSL